MSSIYFQKARLGEPSERQAAVRFRIIDSDRFPLKDAGYLCLCTQLGDNELVARED